MNPDSEWEASGDQLVDREVAGFSDRKKLRAQLYAGLFILGVHVSCVYLLLHAMRMH